MRRSRIPAKSAVIFWNDDPKKPNRVGGSEVLVARFEDTRRDDNPRHLSCSAGADSEGWMTSGHAIDNPAGRFASVWLRRDASPDAIRAALVQFAQIEECEWAREMLAAFDYVDGLE